MHLLKIVIYNRLSGSSRRTWLLGIGHGTLHGCRNLCGPALVRHMEKGKFQKYVAVLLCIVGLYMLAGG